MLKPRVGLMTLVSSPLIFITIVVFPELSSPLHPHHSTVKIQRLRASPGRANAIDKQAQSALHHQNPHFFLFSLDLPDDAEETHHCDHQLLQRTSSRTNEQARDLTSC